MKTTRGTLALDTRGLQRENNYVLNRAGGYFLQEGEFTIWLLSQPYSCVLNNYVLNRAVVILFKLLLKDYLMCSQVSISWESYFKTTQAYKT